MAEEEKAAAPAKSNKGLIIALVVVLVLLTGGLAATGTLLFLQSQETAAEGEDGEVAEEEQMPLEPPPTPIFISMDPFTVNLQGFSDQFRRNLFYVGINLKVKNKESETYLQEHMLELKSRMINLMSAQEAVFLTTPEGRTELAQKALAEASRPYSDPPYPFEIEGVYFSEFIVQ